MSGFLKRKTDIAVVGLWHLGLVTSISLANIGFRVTAFDDDIELINNLKNSKLPIYEKNINNYLTKAKKNNNICFEYNLKLLKSFDKIWVCYDTPLKKFNSPDVSFIKKKIIKISKYIKAGTTIIISSQIPIGFISAIKKQIKKKIFLSYSPENLRLGSSFDSFLKPERIIIGHDRESNKKKLFTIFSKISKNLIFVKNQSAELIKHTLNSYLATSIAFSNEVGYICEKYDADPDELVKGLKSDSRIGEKAYVRPGEAFAGGTLARDLKYLVKSSKKIKSKNLIFRSVLISNNHHRNWIYEKIKFLKKNKTIKDQNTILFLGLSYKKNSNVLRDSNIMRIVKKVKKLKLKVLIYDNNIDLNGNKNFLITSDLKSALKSSQVIVSHSEFKNKNLNKKNLNKDKVLIDCSGSLNNFKYLKFYNRFGLQ